MKKMIYIGDEEREIPQHGVFKTGDEVEFNKTLYSTGLFREKKARNVEKEGEE
ncbi:hypothetical protein [Bacillus sp. 03113]|uniref:hypothetical protein n=1 Tax=Bacillus sp. 03113 TaxID=2578211 RepID=UPI0015E89C5F|nr:hypothetical protein [Bacillus sp. 03113]